MKQICRHCGVKIGVFNSRFVKHFRWHEDDQKSEVCPGSQTNPKEPKEEKK